MSEKRTNHVYLEGLIQEYQREGFRVGLYVERDGFNRKQFFDGGMDSSADMYAYMHKREALKQAETDAERIYNDHIASLNPAEGATL